MAMLLFQQLGIDVKVVHHFICMVFLERFLRYRSIIKSKHVGSVCIGTYKFPTDKTLASRNNLVSYDFIRH